MIQEKLERIRDINDEVAELHPLLNVLLGRLPTVVSVEYTHGQNEMGADFVFVRNDDAIMEQTYVGLIAKAGQIKQNHEDLKRQIDECSLERKIEGGKKSIYLSEIWVVTTKGISHNAQLKIHESYKTRSIKFIDGPKLSALIDKYYPEYWTDVTVVVGEYLRDMLVKAGELETRSDLLDLDSDLFIKRKLLKIDPPQDRSIRRTKGKKIIREQPEIVLKRDSLIFIEGHMGAGKSKLIGSLAKHFSDPAVVNHREEFPFLITAVDLYREYSGDIDKFISDTIKKYNLPEGKKKLVFIDALDELKLSIDDRISFVSNIHSKSHNSDDIRVVVTSREIDEPSLNTLAHKLFDRYELEPLTMREIFSVVEEVCKGLDIVEKIRKDVSRSHLFREMPKTPIAAIILAKLIREDQNEIPSTMTDLYQKYTELVLGRWDVRKGLVSIKDYEILTHIVMKISSFMMDNGLEDIPEGDVFSLVEEYLSARNLNYRTESVGNMLKSRRNLLHYDTTKHTFSFRHRSFLELLRLMDETE